MLKISLTKLVLIFTAAAILLVGSANSAQAERWQNRVDPSILETAASNGSAEFLVQMKAQADLGPASQLKTKTEKGAFVYQTLNKLALQTQQPLIKQLQQLGIPYRSHWVVNAIWVRGDMETIHWLAERPEVAHLLDNPAMRVPLPEGTPSLEAQAATESLSAPTTIPWNLTLVRADEVWQGGYTGKNVVVGGADTGYEWDHPALINQYRGWNGITADHNYNWHDAFNTTDSETCTFLSAFPVDDHGHGTHTMGIMVGDDGGSHQIGMAPGAEWIGCRNMQNGVGTPDSYIQCFEFFIAPTDTHCQNPDPSKAPDVINNSWACVTTEGCTLDQINILQDAVEAVRAAGILSVQSAGNYSNFYEYCSTVKTPAATYDASFTVANTNSLDQVVSNSSRGPVTVDGSGRLKPDIAAPGDSIYSSYLYDTYRSMSGTSMSAPHVAGLAALLISARPSLAGQVDQIEQYIQNSAVPVTDPYYPGCGGIPITTTPNNSAGWGRIDAWAAIDLLYPYKLYYPFVPVDVLEGE